MISLKIVLPLFWAKEARYKRPETVWFCLHEVQEQAELTYANRSQNNSCVWEGDVHWEGA